MNIELRKMEHILICLNCNVEYDKTTLLEDIELVHRGSGNVNYDDIDTEIKLFGKTLSAL